MERLQKVIASSGFCSRRKAEEYITSGKVYVNNEKITELGTKVSYDDEIEVDGQILSAKEEKEYYLLYKPTKTVSSVKDDKGRDTVVSLIPSKSRIYPIGRLDYDTKGVILLTNDGDFMNKLVGPQSKIEKEQLARVEGIFSKEDLKKICLGVNIGDYTTRKCRGYISGYDKENNSSLVGLIIKEGRYHQVKRMFDALGFRVKRLTRVRFGDIDTKDIPEGGVKELSIHQIKRLYALANGGEE